MKYFRILGMPIVPFKYKHITTDVIGAISPIKNLNVLPFFSIDKKFFQRQTEMQCYLPVNTSNQKLAQQTENRLETKNSLGKGNWKGNGNAIAPSPPNVRSDICLFNIVLSSHLCRFFCYSVMVVMRGSVSAGVCYSSDGARCGIILWISPPGRCLYGCFIPLLKQYSIEYYSHYGHHCICDPLCTLLIVALLYNICYGTQHPH